VREHWSSHWAGCLTICGLEFGQQYQGRIAVIVKALYGLKSSGAAWHNMLSSTLHDLGFKSSLADADVWMRPNVKSNGEHYYDYIFVYVDDLLVLSAYARDIMETIGKTYHFKDGSVGPPKTYLGAEVKEFQQPHNPTEHMWSLSADISMSTMPCSKWKNQLVVSERNCQPKWSHP